MLQRGDELTGLAVGEYRLELLLPQLLQTGQVNGLALGLQRVVHGGEAEELTGGGIKQLQNDRAVGGLEQIVQVDVIGQLQTHMVADAHLEQCLGHTAVARRGGSQHLALVDHLFDGLVNGNQAADLGQTVLVVGAQDDNGAVGLLELGALHVVGVADGRRKADERRGHVQALKAAGHRVLAADGRNAQTHLGIQRTEQGGQRLAPALGLIVHMLKIFLERQVHALVVEARADQLGHALDHGHIRAAVGVSLGQVGVEAPRHAGAGRRLAVHWQLGGHGHRRGQLVLAAVGHQHGGCADGGVEPLAQALLAADVQVADHGFQLLLKRCTGKLGLPDMARQDVRISVALGTVGVQKLAGEVNDGLAVPDLAHPLFLGDGGNDSRLKVFLGGVLHKGLGVLGSNGHGHALLALRNGQLGAVQTLVLAGDLVQVDVQAVGQLTDGDRHTACAEVVAALDKAAGVLAAEQALQLALDGRVALLHLGTAGLKACQLMRLGGTGGTADTVAPRASAQQDDDITRGGLLAADMAGRRRADNCADLHALGGVAGVVQLCDLTGGKADLVAVAGIARGSRRDQLALGQLAGHCLGNRLQRVSRTGHAHGLIDIAASGQRVTDGTANAGRRAAEGLDLGGVVVGLVLEQEQPVLLLTVHVTLDLDGAGVDLLALVKVLQNAALLQRLGTDGRAVHQGAVFLVAARLGAQCHVAVKCGLHKLVVDLHVVQDRAERRMAAVVGPVGVDQTDLGDGRVAVFGFEVVLAEHDVRMVHRQALLIAECFQRVVVQRGEAGQCLDLRRDGKLHFQGTALVKACLAGFDGVDDVLLDGGQVGVGQVAVQQIDAGGAHRGALALAQQLDALAGRVSALVKLAGQVLDGKNGLGVGQLVVGHVNRRFTEHGGHSLLEQHCVDALDVIAVQKAQTGQILDADQIDQLMQKPLCLAVKAGLFLNINAIYHCISS